MRTKDGRDAAGLASLTLKGIGPFAQELRVPLALGGTLLLGAGKTTALRAAVLAVLPKDVADQAPGCVTSPLSSGASSGWARVNLATGAWAKVGLCRRHDHGGAGFFVGESSAGEGGERGLWGRRVFAYGDGRRGIGRNSGGSLPTGDHPWRGVESLFHEAPFAYSPESLLREAHRLSFYEDSTQRYAWDTVRRAAERMLGRGAVSFDGDGRPTLGGLPLRDASAGVRSLASWVIDATARWCAAEADEGREPSPDDLETMDPILVVDSIDENLPPAEHALIFDRTREVFPRASLLASATSPLTACGARAGEAVWLRRSAAGGWSAEAAPDLRTATAAELLSFADVGDPPHPLGRDAARHDALAREALRSDEQEHEMNAAADRLRAAGMEPRRRPLHDPRRP